MTIEQLLALDAIVQTGSFRSAAQQLHKAQSAISYAIKSLEDQYQIKIFSRDSYRPRLTKSGQSFYKKAMEVLEKAEELDNFGKAMANIPESIIRFSVSSICPIDEVNKCLQKIVKKFPDTRVSLRMEIFKGEEHLISEDADIAIVGKITHSKKLKYIHLAQVDMPIVVSAKHKIAGIDRPLKREDILPYPQLVVSSHYEQDVRSYTGIIEGATLWFVSGLYTKLRLVSAGLGWGRIPYHMIERGLKRGSLKIVNLKSEKKVSFSFHLVRLKDKVHGPVCDYIWKNLRFEKN